MHFLIPLASLLGIELESMTDRLKARAITFGLIALCCLLGAGFLLGAIFILVAAQVGPLYASLIFAGLFLLVALAVFLGAQISEGRYRREMAQRRRSSEKGAFISTAAATALPLLARSPTIVKLGLPAIAIAAFALMKGRAD